MRVAGNGQRETASATATLLENQHNYCAIKLRIANGNTTANAGSYMQMQGGDTAAAARN